MGFAWYTIMYAQVNLYIKLRSYSMYIVYNMYVYTVYAVYTVR